MWHHVTNHLIISNDKDSNSENRIKLRVRDSELFMVFSIQCPDFGQDCVFPSERSPSQSRKMQ
jgi:hypothetical protein